MWDIFYYFPVFFFTFNTICGLFCGVFSISVEQARVELQFFLLCLPSFASRFHWFQGLPPSLTRIHSAANEHSDINMWLGLSCESEDEIFCLEHPAQTGSMVIWALWRCTHTIKHWVGFEIYSAGNRNAIHLSYSRLGACPWVGA